jgi:pSer/pThr/pTyr-binding forkhead associated (FHA) protein
MIEPPLVAPSVSDGPDGARDDAIGPLEPVAIPAVGDRTAVFAVPTSDGPRATLRELRPDGTSRTIAFDGRPLTIGRAPDNGLVVRDGRASRHHARIDGRRGTLVLSDLGSSNGSFVNDRRVDSVALGAGDRIRIGTTAFVVEGIGEDLTDASGR